MTMIDSSGLVGSLQWISHIYTTFTQASLGYILSRFYRLSKQFYIYCVPKTGTLS